MMRAKDNIKKGTVTDVLFEDASVSVYKETVYDEDAVPSMKDGVPKGLYIHIPFCASKCNYCDFASYTGCSEKEIDEYFQALYVEIDALVEWLDDVAIFDTVFIGGGTPSIVAVDYIYEALARVPRTPDAEVSIEVNPGSLIEYEFGLHGKNRAVEYSVCRNKAESYARAGVNRISLGVQSLLDAELQYLGRIHTAAMAEEAVALIREAGIDNVNIDLIFGFPGHTLENWKYTLKRTIAMSPSHLSFYSLQIEENTPMYEAFRAGTAIQIPQELDRKMYSFVLEILKASGYKHYEISNAAFPGFECRHNLKYWSMKDYIGVGAAAHSFIGGCRFENPGSISDYTALINKNKSQYGRVLYGNLHYIQRQSVEELISDCIFTQLRTVEGIDLIQFRQRYGIDLSEYKRDVIAKYIADGCLNFDEGRIHLTNKGIDISNLIISELM